MFIFKNKRLNIAETAGEKPNTEGDLFFFSTFVKMKILMIFSDDIIYGEMICVFYEESKKFKIEFLSI